MQWTRITAWAALAAYAAALGGRSSLRKGQLPPPWVRGCWTLGAGLLWLHLVVAFHTVHHWSHTAAWEDTARQTAELVGIRRGDGLWLNYLLTALWTADAGWWWWAGTARYEQRPRWIAASLQGFLAFMAFQATVVFGSGPARWGGALVTATLLFLFWRRAWGSSDSRDAAPGD